MINKKNIKKTIWDKLSFFIVSLFGVGFFKFASGTIGSMCSFIFIVPIAKMYGTAGLLSLIFATFIIGYFTIKKVLKFTKHDPSFIVIDELLGQTVTFLFIGKVVPPVFLSFVFGFVLFRLFDITKPWIIGTIDKKMKNAVGVLMDDFVAGLFAAVSLVILNLILVFLFLV